ncbi:MAG TPA: protein kinase, partial [Byssovorax sp.]
MLAGDVPRMTDLGEPRYDLGASLGTGGVGRVIAARDREIGRSVALKMLKAESAAPSVIERFVTEAKVTAQLEHPNVVPVYDMGTLPNGQPFYTMRVTKRQSLQDVLGNPELRRQWPLFRLIGAFVQVSRALAYAHSRGVLHRDIKPENILLGDFGEVYLADWGNAKTLACPEGSDPLQLPTSEREEGEQPSGLSGTPGYISPEQIRGERAVIDHRADIFALGVVLYEMLAGEHPFDAATVLAVILATQTREAKRPSEIAPGCPLVLEDLCLAMLQKDPAKRPASAEKVASEAEAFLEGAKEKARRREEARKLCEAAAVPVARTRMLAAEYESSMAEARELLKEIKGHEPLDAKRPGWTLEDRARSVERDQARALAEAIELYTKALAYDPQLVEARAGLADLYWSRAVDAEDKRAAALQIHYETLVAEFDDGRYMALMRSDATITVDASLPGAAVVAHQYVERDHVLVKGEPRYLGRTPLREARVPPGSYLIVLKHAGCRDVNYPTLLRRGEHVSLSINLYTDAEIGAGFVYVPGGPCLVGGDTAAAETLPRAVVEVGDFAIARYPVTFREYCAFLDDLEQLDPAIARKRAPHDLRGSEGFLVRQRADGRWEPHPALIEGDARGMFPMEEGHFWNVTAMLVDWFDAVAFCKWRGEKDGAVLRLPTELEWEKAARG